MLLPMGNSCASGQVGVRRERFEILTPSFVNRKGFNLCLRAHAHIDSCKLVLCVYVCVADLEMMCYNVSIVQL